MKKYKGLLFLTLTIFLIGMVSAVVNIGKNLDIGNGNITNANRVEAQFVLQDGRPLLGNTSGDYLYTINENKTVVFNNTKSDERYFIRNQNINITEKNITNVNQIVLNLGIVGDNTTCTVITGPTSNLYLC